MYLNWSTLLAPPFVPMYLYSFSNPIISWSPVYLDFCGTGIGKKPLTLYLGLASVILSDLDLALISATIEANNLAADDLCSINEFNSLESLSFSIVELYCLVEIAACLLVIAPSNSFTCAESLVLSSDNCLSSLNAGLSVI